MVESEYGVHAEKMSRSSFFHFSRPNIYTHAGDEEVEILTGKDSIEKMVAMRTKTS